MNKRISSVACILLVGIGLFSIGCGGGNDTPDPEISGIQPESGPPGTAVTIFGQGFSPELSENQVTFAGTVAAISSATETEINTEVPGSPGQPPTPRLPTVSPTGNICRDAAAELILKRPVKMSVSIIEI